MQRIARHLQGGEILIHQARGGSIAFNWLALGVGLLALIAVMIVHFAVLIPLVMLGYIESSKLSNPRTVTPFDSIRTLNNPGQRWCSNQLAVHGY